MKNLALLLLLAALPATAATTPTEHLGTESFSISCAPPTQAPFNRGMALLHDFWYAEAQPQFERLTKSDPACAMAHWGVAMSVFHQIWDRPTAETNRLGWAEMQKAQALHVGTDRERAYIAALADFYRPGPSDFPARIAAYSAAMGKLYAQYPNDVDAGAFYALSLLGARAPNDTSLVQDHKAMAVLVPLLAKYPDHPGVLHYITHACDNPAMAPDGLTAANHYGEVAPSGPHAFHMPGHIYARLGLWQQDIASQLGSIAASEAAEKRGISAVMDEPHSYDFLIYAYLQSGDDARAKAALAQVSTSLTKIGSMPGMGAAYMAGMVPNYRAKLPAFYALERRDWISAAALEPPSGSPPQSQFVVYWTRAIAHGRLHQPQLAHSDLGHYDQLLTDLKKGSFAYLTEGTAAKIQRTEIVAWTAFADGNQSEALARMREAADLQDKVGQGEVDIPAREMLADMLVEFNHPKEALPEYAIALKSSPNRLNGLYDAGRAAEAAGDKTKAKFYYTALLKSTHNGANSTRPEFSHAKTFLAPPRVSAN